MATAWITQLRFEGERFPKPITARFDVAHASTDGGALLLKAVDATLGLEKVVPNGEQTSRVAGAVLIVAGVAVAPAPRL